jgi:glucan phosphorylase
MEASTSLRPKLLDQVRDKMRLKHYSIRTEQAYLDWIKRFVVFSGKRHPRDMSGGGVHQRTRFWPPPMFGQNTA